MSPSAPLWSLVIHGGSGRMTRPTMTADAEAGFRAGLATALAVGSAILDSGGTALDAVEAAVMTLEDDPQFNAGRGAVFTAEGRNELDAAIMDGSSRAAGAVAGVTRTRNPVALARAVMERTPHVLLAREGADCFALEAGLPQVDPAWFGTDARWQALTAMKAAAARGESVFDKTLKYGTVGAVARDSAGHLAAATSTGGLTGKRWGRIGDSPIIGAGTYADDRSVAVSATGSGEDFIRVAAGHEIGARVRLRGDDTQTAADAVIEELRRIDGDGGVIFVGADGSAGWSFNTPGMFRARVTASQSPLVAIFDDEG
ncbi:isoaspartyl peptidase/L-asparaginase family protein [Polymorphobacter fuscus]|uniref:Isoaspartyl peptidase n=1 Tax=Sandarakinorhabdus fusca TaxID=1439888 RepID=A0A7C9KG89_9SPHN|nr:isoaspartyl peptidase/L-asparaginase [Polymorphobacter fuscus]KAB7648385.1 isoaspartyl peptidase/L-asparaginase [Polymorphobacter fuscus]MQT15900.1 isoaspartyl peptidase/L-asparaginase [Polymorphobacter fuscus]NJC07826.1 beta-aspartyl-peptidase (threonine type) [Polymorphobacter fuscus]